MPTSRMVPCRKSAGASTTTAWYYGQESTLTYFDGTQHRGASDRPVQLTGQHHDRHERRHQPAQAQDHLCGVATLAGQERFDEHTGDGHTEHDQHGREQAVFDARCGHHRDGPSAIRGVGSG